MEQLEFEFASARQALAHVRELHVPYIKKLSAVINRFVGACANLEEVDFYFSTRIDESLRNEFVASLSSHVRVLRSNFYDLADLKPVVALADRGVRLRKLDLTGPLLDSADTQKLEHELADLRRNHPDVQLECSVWAEPRWRLLQFVDILDRSGIRLVKLDICYLSFEFTTTFYQSLNMPLDFATITPALHNLRYLEICIEDNNGDCHSCCTWTQWRAGVRSCKNRP